MAQQNPVPGSLKDFLADGIEAAECTICTEPFDNEHVVIQTKECVHVMGKLCLEKWLRQNKSQGTCPPCRGVLFKTETTKKKTRPIPRLENTNPSGFSPTFERSSIYYGNRAVLERSIQTGFLNGLWTGVLARSMNGEGIVSPPVLSACIVAAYDQLHLHSPDERSEGVFLAPYIPRTYFPTTAPLCSLTQLAGVLCKFSKICGENYTPPKTVWSAILLFFSRPADSNVGLSWTGLRDAAWTLYGGHLEGKVGASQWRWLYLFLWMMAIYRANHPNYHSFEIQDVRPLLRALGIGYPSEARDETDTNTRLFLSAAVQAFERNRIGTNHGQLDRARRLLQGDADMGQLKKDVESVWLEGMAKGAAYVAIGYPEYWWSGD